LVGQIGTLTGVPRGWRIFYDDGTSYKSTMNTLPNLRDEWNNQTKTGIIIVVVIYEDKYTTIDEDGIEVTRHYRRIVTDKNWVWYNPVTKQYRGGQIEPTGPSGNNKKDMSSSRHIIVDNSGNELDDVENADIALIRTKLGNLYSKLTENEVWT